MSREESTDGLRRYVLEGSAAGETISERALGICLWYRTWLMVFVLFAGVAALNVIEGSIWAFIVGGMTWSCADWVYRR